MEPKSPIRRYALFSRHLDLRYTELSYLRGKNGYADVVPEV